MRRGGKQRGKHRKHGNTETAQSEWGFLASRQVKVKGNSYIFNLVMRLQWNWSAPQSPTQRGRETDDMIKCAGVY